ncbi:MAG TPA: peptidoglycan-binding domain-containing protein, partial [Blastocatellia bacterium]|nr:peptidoglycan-binding domain-containing protein [Blastocatellia bacterium]
GHVTGTTPAERGSKTGTIAVAFDRLIIGNGPSAQVDGTLTTLSDEGRRQLDSDEVDSEDSIGGGSRTRRAVVFIGGGAGAGAIIGAIAGGGKGAAVGAGVGAVLGTLGVLLTKGDKAEVAPGTEFAMRVERSFNVNAGAVGVAGDREVREFSTDGQFNNSNQNVFSSYESIRFAQISLRDRGYYTGQINGQMTPATRSAIREFQREAGLPLTGDLDSRTARELGIANESGVEGATIDIVDARAERVGRDSIRINLDVRTQGGTQVFINRFVRADALHVYVRGTNPRFSSGGGAGNRQPFTETYDNMPNVRRVIFHGPQRDITVDLLGGPSGGTGTGAGGGSGVGNARQIAFLANRLLQDYQRDLNVRGTRGQITFDARRNFRENEVEVLFQFDALRSSAELYNQMVNNVTDPDALKGAADSLLRQVRLANRAVKRGQGTSLSSVVMSDWEQLRTELARISITDNNLDADVDRIR